MVKARDDRWLPHEVVGGVQVPIGLGRNQRHTRTRHSRGDQRGVGERSDPQRDIHARCHDIGFAVGDLEVEYDFGKAIGKFPQSRDEVQLGKGGRYHDAHGSCEPSPIFLCSNFCGRSSSNRAFGTVAVPASCLGECKASGRALEQPDTEIGFELRHGFRDRRLSDVEPAGCRRKGARLGDGEKLLHDG